MQCSFFLRNTFSKRLFKTILFRNDVYKVNIRSFSNEIHSLKSTKELSNDLIGKTVKLEGWLHFMRKMGKIVFFVVNDGYEDIQIKMVKDIGI